MTRFNESTRVESAAVFPILSVLFKGAWQRGYIATSPLIEETASKLNCIANVYFSEREKPENLGKTSRGKVDNHQTQSIHGIEGGIEPWLHWWAHCFPIQFKLLFTKLMPNGSTRDLFGDDFLR